MSQDSAVVKSKNFRNNTKMLTARIPLGMVRKFETTVPAGARSQFVVKALAAALDRRVEELSGAGTGSELVLQ